MGWSAQQNPTGVRNPAFAPTPVKPLDIAMTSVDARRALVVRARAKMVGSRFDLPIAANARKVDGFAPRETSPVL